VAADQEATMTTRTTQVTQTTLSLPRRHRLPAWGLTLGTLLVAELILFTVTTRHFAEHGRGMLHLTEQFAPTGVIALGLAFVILTGNIDLSVGAIASLSAIVVAVELHDGTSMWIAVLIAVLVGVGFGLFNGLVISLFGIDSLLVTLATQFIATSLATSIGGQNPPYSFGKAFDRLGTGTALGVPIDLIVFALLALVTVVVVTHTGLGRALVLVGYSLVVARYTGIRTRAVVTAVFSLSGLYSGVAGVLLAAYYDSARSDIGTVLLLPAITMVVLGGVDIFGGAGRIGEVVIAVFLLGYLTQGLLIEGYSSLTATMVTGLLLIGALVAKIYIERVAGESWSAAARRLLHQRVKAKPS
jgi:AI-2 transport system permease protein